MVVRGCRRTCCGFVRPRCGDVFMLMRAEKRFIEVIVAQSSFGCL